MSDPILNEQAPVQTRAQFPIEIAGGRHVEVSVTVPRRIQIKLVDVNVLGDFEIWMWISSGLLSICTGLFVAIFQGPENRALILANLTIFAVFTAASFYRMTKVRSRLDSAQEPADNEPQFRHVVLGASSASETPARREDP